MGLFITGSGLYATDQAQSGQEPEQSRKDKSDYSKDEANKLLAIKRLPKRLKDLQQEISQKPNSIEKIKIVIQNESLLKSLGIYTLRDFNLKISDSIKNANDDAEKITKDEEELIDAAELTPTSKVESSFGYENGEES